VRFPFGHGGSYTAWELGLPDPATATFHAGQGERLVVRVPVTNAGDRRGAQVVQCYVAPASPRVTRPPKELAAFAKVWLDPGATEVVELTLDDRSFAYWDPGEPDRSEISARAAAVPMRGGRAPARAPGWRVDPGGYALHVGTSSAAIDHVVPVEVG
jgi:hypothetical protein